jgi:hypothetical protein
VALALPRFPRVGPVPAPVVNNNRLQRTRELELIDRLNEADDAEDELRVIDKQLTRLCFRVSPSDK